MQTKHDDLLVCNCAGCGKELLSRKHQAQKKSGDGLPPLVAGRIDDRPYCKTCLYVPRWTTAGRLVTKIDQEPDPSLETAVRAMEDGSDL